MLEHHGFEVVEACDGAEALDQVRRRAEPFVCVLMDLTMPVLDGHETLLRLRELDADVPVILSSGYTPTAGRSCLSCSGA